MQTNQPQIATIKSKDIVGYQNVAVVTTRMLADYYETEPAQVLNNFNRNSERFIEGKHYFRLAGEERKNWHLSLSKRYGKIIDMRGGNILLWTKRGTFNHAKLINTDQAWNVYEMLQDFYFEFYEGKRVGCSGMK